MGGVIWKDEWEAAWCFGFLVCVGELEWGFGIEALTGALGGMGGKWLVVMTFQGATLGVVEYINSILPGNVCGGQSQKEIRSMSRNGS